MDVFPRRCRVSIDPPDLGGLEADLRHHLSATAQFLAADDAGAVFRALIGQSQHDGQLADDFRGRYLREQQARDQILIARAVARGELPADVDVAHVAEQLVAPLYYRVIVTGRRSTPRLLTGLSRISCAAGNNVSSIDIMVTMTETDPHDFHANVMSEIRETGRASGFFAQFDMLILHTVGAKSGQPRQNPMAYQPGGEGGEFYVFASNNGRDTSSAWYYNALAHPDRVEVEIGDDRFRVSVRDVVGQERDRIYARQAGKFENFAEYERKTTRVIPVLGLTRVD